jgi:hypothetical protein
VIRPSRTEFAELASHYTLVPVVRELTADTVTPTGLLLRLTRFGRQVASGWRVGLLPAPTPSGS